MKTATIQRSNFQARENAPHPNAATRQEILHKFLDLFLVAGIGAGLAACLIFLIALG